LPAWKPIRWRVDRVTLIARGEEGPFRSVFEVPLGGGEVRGIIQPAPPAEGGGLDDGAACWLQRLQQPEATEQEEGAWQRAGCQGILERLDALVAAITGQTGAVQLAGSWRLGVAGPDSDVDVVCLHPPQLARLDFFRRLQELLLTQQADEVCFVANAR